MTKLVSFKKHLFLGLIFIIHFGCDTPTYKKPTSAFGVVPFNDENPYDARVVALGKKLFFDKRLSKNNTVSCADCHKPHYAFSDRGNKKSETPHGISARNTPALFNLAWFKGYFWDGGSVALEAQALAPFQNKAEMHLPISELERKINVFPEYVSQIKKIWNEDKVTARHVVFALAQYQRTLISDKSDFDRLHAVLLKKDSLYALGFQLVVSHCAPCHTPPLFTDLAYHNNGLDSIIQDNPPLYENWGRKRITLKNDDLGKYRTPSLRNLLFTAPYMHDGRFATLEAVLEHYSKEIKYTSTLDTLLPEGGFHFAKLQKTAILHFLEHLNDSSFIKTHSAGF